MKNNKSNSRSKGSVLIAVIGILAVLSVMALRFNVEMETAMMKTAGKNLASDVKVLANSGKDYVIARILGNGKSFEEKKLGTSTPEFTTQLLIEEQMEMQNIKAPVVDKIGTGVAEVVERYNATAFYGGTSSTLSQGYISDGINLSPGTINFMIEDTSAKLPIGHVSQWYQRHLISSVLCHLLTGKVPSNPTASINTELFEDTEASANADSKKYDGSVLVRSLIPYDMAKEFGSGSTAHLNAPGIPLADGIHAVEELGASYTWIKGTLSEGAKVMATDYSRSTKDYRLLSGALTPYARFIHDVNYQKGSSTPADSNVSYASINPMVMSRQNFGLYQSLFYYDPDDFRLKRYFSVSFPPINKATDDISTLDSPISALVKENYFKDNIDSARIISTEMAAGGDADISLWSGTSAVYNARNNKSDLHSSTLLPAITSEKVKIWTDREFAAAPKKETAYYIAMDKAVERLSRAFKGMSGHKLPAENTLCPIITRKTLEFAIISSVFGDAITFADTSDRLYVEEVVDYLRLYNAIENGDIDLDNVKFVQNAFTRLAKDDASMEADYFVPFWKNYNLGIVHNSAPGAGKFSEVGDAIIEIPSLGLYKTGGKYINYLPHPQTNQSKLNSVYTSIITAYSHKNLGLLRETSGTGLAVQSLYVSGTTPGIRCKINNTDVNDAYLELPVGPGALILNNAIPGPGDDYMPLNFVDITPGTEDVNFIPADFTPYETQIRMAVLVNLLNAIIPAEVTPTKNSLDSNATLFTTNSTGTVAKTLKEFIYFKDKQYQVNTSADNVNGLPSYLNGWDGKIRTPGMTFWKFGVHSTTFQITVDAFKYDDSARLSTVVTFDNSVLTSTAAPGAWDKLKPFYEIDYPADNAKSLEAKTAVKSSIYLNPLGRSIINSNYFSIGKGELRYPTDTDTDSWAILSSVWSSTFGRSGQEVNEYFVPILLFPGDVVNIGPDGGSWHYVPHPAEPVPFTRFFVDSNGSSFLSGGGSANKNDYSTGALETRNRSFGKGSWIKWKATFTKGMAANKLDLMLSRTGANANSGYAQDHAITITKISTKQVMCVIPFTTVSNWSYQVDFIKTIPVAVEAGEYEIKLEETKDSNPGGYGDEKVFKVTIYAN